MISDLFPKRIVCLTEETTEWLYLLGEDARIVGISGYTVRPRRAREEKPKVSAFLNAKIDKILALKPDCVFGFSDLQADIAALLIRAGVQVTVFNQRSVDEIFAMLYQVAAMVGQAEQGLQRLQQMRAQLDAIQSTAATFKRRPKVYFEEWDEPHISAIRWVSEASQVVTIVFRSWRKCRWGKTASLPVAKSLWTVSLTSSLARCVVRSFAQKKQRHVKVGKMYPRYAPSKFLKSSRLIFCSLARLH